MSADTNERTLLAPLFLQHAGASPAVAASLSILAGYNLCTDAPLALSADPHSATDALLCVIARLQARGLHARYTIAPADSLSHLATCGPLVLATDSPLDTPAGLLVVWRRFGPLFQALDTQAGRRWFAVRQLKQFADETVTSIACAEWRRYAVADAWILRSRLVQLTQDEDAAERITQAALAAPGWRPLAALDAALRLGDTLAAAGAIERGNEARTQIERLISQTLASPDGVSGPIPTAFWAVQAESEDTLLCRGVPVVLCVGLAEGVPAARQPRPRPSRPGRLADYWCDQPGRLGLLVAGAGVAAAGVVTQVMLLRGLLALGQLLPTLGQRTVTVGLLLAFVLSLLLLEVSLATLLGRQGRRLDARLRMAFMTLLPRLGSQTFQHLSTADLMERIHTARDLHNLPDLSGQIARTFFQIIFTLLGLALISPLCAAVGLVNVILVLGLVLAGAELAGAQNRMLRAALSDLSRLALDSMLGSVAIHAHLAGSALTSEHEQRLVRWAH
ncbi:MAG: ABC transporter ATP-binding protein, partial [Oscillochloris sp.]|nr:ABC transporter ATP-binding protein [Oscillochloris sp.]